MERNHLNSVIIDGRITKLPQKIKNKADLYNFTIISSSNFNSGKKNNIKQSMVNIVSTSKLLESNQKKLNLDGQVRIVGYMQNSKNKECIDIVAENIENRQKKCDNTNKFEAGVNSIYLEGIINSRVTIFGNYLNFQIKSYKYKLIKNEIKKHINYFTIIKKFNPSKPEEINSSNIKGNNIRILGKIFNEKKRTLIVAEYMELRERKEE